MNPNKKEAVAAPILSPRMSSQQLGSSPSSRSLFAPHLRSARAFPHSWLLHLGGENLEKVSLQCCLAVLVKQAGVYYIALLYANSFIWGF